MLALRSTPLPLCQCFVARGFFGAATSSKYNARKKIPFSAAQMYSVVADVDRYKEFLPYCSDSKVLKRTRQDAQLEHLEAELAVEYGVFSARYISRVELRPSTSVRGVSEDTALFKSLVHQWKFLPVDGGDGAPSCWVDFAIEYQFQSALHAAAAGAVFENVSSQMISSFEARCADVHRSSSSSSSPSQSPQPLP
eukprot:gnl/Spiro4/10467_TR5606_c0_g1_i1.p1 gnl/Spiro4/10467_TR5606_c0_g1~~gnl/Spiro4/10467_TR5606_c0_g1_i1.p1  ORF type:complete len:195 (-),score=23.68 gnl/Spiro4/10467_TR5606_c0_g1_i1:74-658(-)